jgi:quinol monooxygenase YgiN
MGTGRVLLISLWQSQAAMQAAQRDHRYQQQVTTFTAFLAVPPVEDAYEVSVLSAGVRSAPDARQ